MSHQIAIGTATAVATRPSADTLSTNTGCRSTSLYGNDAAPRRGTPVSQQARAQQQWGDHPSRGTGCRNRNTDTSTACIACVVDLALGTTRTLAPPDARSGDEGGMMARMNIGEFAQASGLTAKALRLYDKLNLLTPAELHPHTGDRKSVVQGKSVADTPYAL